MYSTCSGESAAVARRIYRNETSSAPPALRVLVLPDGVAYIGVSAFLPLELTLRPLYEALRQVADADGLIIDLRNNAGGDPRSAALLASTLFDTESVQLNDRYHVGNEPHDDSAVPIARRYLGPVVVLLGRRSSALAWRFARNLREMTRVRLVGEVPEMTRGQRGATLDLVVPEQIALRQSHEVLAARIR